MFFSRGESDSTITYVLQSIFIPKPSSFILHFATFKLFSLFFKSPQILFIASESSGISDGPIDIFENLSPIIQRHPCHPPSRQDLPSERYIAKNTFPVRQLGSITNPSLILNHYTQSLPGQNLQRYFVNLLCSKKVEIIYFLAMKY